MCGVHQGDPHSPLLFCLAKEVLSHAITLAHQAELLTPISYVRGVPFPTHILYVDDIMIFCTGTKKNICCLLCIFNYSSEVLGQKINNTKSCFFTGSITNTRVHMVAN